MKIRTLKESDYKEVISALDQWWEGRKMSDMLPKLFFRHFQNTSFVVEQNEEIIAFLIGFQSQTYSNEAYIHFIGVHPNHRKTGIAKHLYELFFEKVTKFGCSIVRCITSPVNKTSVIFHTKMGFQIEKGNNEIEGISVHADYDGKGGNRVLFVKNIYD